MDIPLETDCRTVQSRLEAEEDLLLLDCRERDEYEIAHVSGALLLPMSELPDRHDELDSHRCRDVIVYCHHGIRSLQVVHWMRQHGFPRAQSMAGGIDQWSREIDPSVPRYE